jgi:hypothetical protein
MTHTVHTLLAIALPPLSNAWFWSSMITLAFAVGIGLYLLAGFLVFIWKAIEVIFGIDEPHWWING